MLDLIIKGLIAILAVAIVAGWICYTIKQRITREAVESVIKQGLKRGHYNKIDIGLRKSAQIVDVEKNSNGAEVKCHLSDSRGNREKIKIISSKGTTLRMGSKIAIR